MRLSNRALSVGGLIFAVLCLAACGSGGGLLSADQASELKSQLTNISQSLDAHDCSQAANEISNFRNTVDGLGVSSTLIDNLDQGTSTVSQLARRHCPATTHKRQTPTTTAAPPPTATATPPPTTTAATPPPTTTSAPPPTTTSPASTQTTTTGPSSGGAGIGNGNGNGNGNGTGSGGGGT
jgi:hypothetical protein